MTWNPYYKGTGSPHSVSVALPAPPPWRQFPAVPMGDRFQCPEGLVEAVNAAIQLRRPLLITGAPGSGKSTVVDSISAELDLGSPLRWHITSRSVLADALYRYDVLGRIHAQQLMADKKDEDDIADFLQLGPLGTALAPQDRPRCLLIDEFDKSDFDLPGDLLEVLERGEFEISELARHRQQTVSIREWGSDGRHDIHRGHVACTNFPIIVITSNGEREFSAPFLRRCIRYTMPAPDLNFLRRLVEAHLGSAAARSSTADEVLSSFLARLAHGQTLAIDQLLNAIFLLEGGAPAESGDRNQLRDLLLRELSGT